MHWVGFDVGKAFHWVCVLDGEGERVFSRRVEVTEEVLLGVFPGLEAALDLKREGALLTVTKVATPTAARRLGAARLFRWLKARGVRKAEDLAERVIAAAKAQRRELPAAEPKSALAAELASEMLRSRERLAELDRRLEELLAHNPQAKIVRSLPGMGVVFTAEFLAEVGNLGRFASADSLAAAAGIAPVLRASGAWSHQRRARRGNKVLKRLLYRSAFSCISYHQRSEDFYRKKRAEGKGHHQAVIALARRRVNVLWAMLRDGQTYSERPSQAA
jgi:transposase